jgi:hypothetical protein
VSFIYFILEMPQPNKRKKQLAAVHIAVQDGIGKKRKASTLLEERLKEESKEDSLPIDAIVGPDTISSLHRKKRTPITASIAEAANNTALPDVAMSLPTATAIAEAEVAINTALPDVVTSLPPAEASLPTETVINGPNLNRTVTVPRKIAKRTFPWDEAAGELNLRSLPLQAEDIPARKKPCVEEPLRTATDEAARKTTSPEISAAPPSAPPVNALTRRQSRHQIQFPPMEPSETQLDYVADLSGPVLPPAATVNASTRYRGSRRVIPTRRRSSRPVIPPPSTATVEVLTSRRSRQKTQLSPNETSEAQLDGDNDGDLHLLAWKNRLSELVYYRKIHGHCNVPRNGKNAKLALWVKKQRSNYKLHLVGKKSPMTPFRIQKLESLGFEWDYLGATREERLSELAVFRHIHGHCKVPVHYSENAKLGIWVNKQRANYNLYRDGKKSHMTALRIQELESLGFEWNCLDVVREDRMSDLAEYRKIYGHCNVPYNYSENAKLAIWVNKQRGNYKLYRDGKKSHMTALRVQELESLGFEWNCLGAAREDRLSELAVFRNIHGHCNVPYKCSENAKLAIWVHKQRGNYKLYRDGKKSPMTPFRIQELERLGFEWNCLGATREERLSELAVFRNIHGHCNVPRRYSENAKLGMWVSKQRSNYKLYRDGKKTHMTALRIQELESLGFEWDGKGTVWEDRMSELVDYRQIHGHCNVPRNGKNTNLSCWVKKQRANYKLHLVGKKSPMTPFRIQKLESLGITNGQLEVQVRRSKRKTGIREAEG